MNGKFLLMLGLAKKAGTLSVGTEPCRDAVRSGKAKLVIASNDVSDNTHKRLKDCCAYYNVELICPEWLDMEQLSRAVGSMKLCSAVSVNNEEMKHAVLNKLSEHI